MEDLVLDCIAEKLLAIDQKTTEIAKTTGETNQSIDEIRSRLAVMELKERSSVTPVQQLNPVPAEPVFRQVAWSQTSGSKIGLILIPILSTLGGMVLLSFVLTAGLRTSLILPYLRYQNSTIQPSSSSPPRLSHQLSRTRIKKDNSAKKFRKELPHFIDSNKLVYP